MRAGQFINDDDSVLYAIGNSLMAITAMQEIDAGRGFDGLRGVGLTQQQALKVLSIYNLNIDTSKYESELALNALTPTNISLLGVYLSSIGLILPPLNSYLGEIRANHAVYAAMANWTL